MKKVFILNNKVKKSTQYAWMQNIKKNCAGEKIIIEKTTSSAQASYVIKKYALDPSEEVHMFVCGGDGTIHQVVNEIAGVDHINLSILPMGTGNDFVKTFDEYTKEDFLDLANYKNPVEMDIDVLKVNGEYVINTASFGFDVQVAREVNNMANKIKGGVFPYYIGMLKSLANLQVYSNDIQIDDQKLDSKEYTFLVLCNGRHYGGGYKPCPKALLDDGYIDVCIVKKVSQKDILTFAKIYEKGEHVNYPELTEFYQGKTIFINTENQEVYANLDGEVRALKNPTIEVIEKAIHLLLPNPFVRETM